MSIFLCFQVYSICTKQTLLQNFAVLYHGGTVLKLQNISLLLSTIHQIFGPLETGPPPDFLGLPLRVSHPRLFPAVLFPNRETGEPDGSDVQVIRHIARKFNFTLKYNILLLYKSMCQTIVYPLVSKRPTPTADLIPRRDFGLGLSDLSPEVRLTAPLATSASLCHGAELLSTASFPLTPRPSEWSSSLPSGRPRSGGWGCSRYSRWTPGWGYR